MQTQVTRTFSFEAAHQLDWHSGACKNLHGHSYRLEVTVSGPLTNDGIVIDFADLSALVQREVIDRVDHRNLNVDVEFMRGVNPTAENIVVACWRVLERHVMPGRLRRLRLWETENNYVEYEGA